MGISKSYVLEEKGPVGAILDLNIWMSGVTKGVVVVNGLTV